MIDLERFWSGDHRHFKELVQAYGPLVLRICRSYATPDVPAEDLFQDTWMRIFENRSRYDGQGPFEGWLFRLSHNTCRSKLRAENARKRVASGVEKHLLREEWVWKPPDPGDEIEKKEAHQGLIHAFEGLPDRARQAVELRYFLELSSTEVAEKMGVNKATVRSLVRYGVQKLRKSWEKR